MEQTNVHMPNSLSSILRMKRFGNKISTTGTPINENLVQKLNVKVQNMFRQNTTKNTEPAIFLKGVSSIDLSNLLAFMYTGEVTLYEAITKAYFRNKKNSKQGSQNVRSNSKHELLFLTIESKDEPRISKGNCRRNFEISGRTT